MSNETILFIVICFLVLVLIIFSIKLGQAHYKIEKQKLELTSINLANELSMLSAKLANASAKKKPQISKTTEQLLNLAVKATNEGEAAAAAKQACRKLYKELGYK